MEKYQKLKVLGKGGFASALLVRCLTSATPTLLVMKQIPLRDLSDRGRHQALQEIACLEQCCKDDHPFICQFHEAFIDSSTDSLCIILHYYSRGDLHSMLSSRTELLDEETVLNYFAQLCLALKHIHDRRVLHRDVKTQNVFIGSDGMLRLGDFGISRALGSTSELAVTAVGTPYYLSPEICRGRPYNSKSDVYSLGCLLYQLCALRHPFAAPNLKQLLAKILDGSYAPIPSSFSSRVHQLIAKLLSAQPEDRPSVNELLRLPFLRVRAQTLLAAFEPVSTAAPPTAPFPVPAAVPIHNQPVREKSSQDAKKQRKYQQPGSPRRSPAHASAHPTTADSSTKASITTTRPTEVNMNASIDEKVTDQGDPPHTDDSFSDSQGLFHFHFMGQTLELTSLPAHQCTMSMRCEQLRAWLEQQIPADRLLAAYRLASSLDLTSSAFLSTGSAALVAERLGGRLAVFTPLLLQLLLCEAIAQLVAGSSHQQQHQNQHQHQNLQHQHQQHDLVHDQKQHVKQK